MTYKEKLISPKWREKRLKILERDSFKCRECENKRIVDNSLSSTVKNLNLIDSHFTALANKSDPRFRQDRPKYRITFSTESNKELSTNIYLKGWEKEKEKDSILGMPVHYLIETIINPKTGEKKKEVIITGIEKKNNTDWFYVGNLHVHHTYYQDGKEPWQYPDDSLCTLCWDCHELLHRNKEVPVLNYEGKRIDSLAPCRRCSGAGYFPQYQHIENGICFRCRGAKYEKFI